jgi:hypothetical protein
MPLLLLDLVVSLCYSYVIICSRACLYYYVRCVQLYYHGLSHAWSVSCTAGGEATKICHLHWNTVGTLGDTYPSEEGTLAGFEY